MARQHKKLHHRLGDAEKLRLYARPAASKNQNLDNSLIKAKAWSKHYELEAKASARKAGSVENERDEAKKEVQLARLAIVEASDKKALVEDKLARVQDSLAVTEKAK